MIFSNHHSLLMNVVARFSVFFDFFQKKVFLTGFLFAVTSLFIWVSCDNSKYPQGEILYTNFCASCHMENGEGLRGIIPPLANSDYVKNNPLSIACAIRNGLEGEIIVNDTIYNQPMAAILRLNDVEITNIINYICQAWGNEYGNVKLEDVKKTLENCR